MAIKYLKNHIGCNFQKPSIIVEFNVVKFLTSFYFLIFFCCFLYLFWWRETIAKSNHGSEKWQFKVLRCNICVPHHDTFLRQMKEMKHENLVQFFGVCIEPPNVCFVMQYCKKGSLKVSTSCTGWASDLRTDTKCLVYLWYFGMLLLWPVTYLLVLLFSSAGCFKVRCWTGWDV